MPKEQINYPQVDALLLIPSDGGYEERPWKYGDVIPEGAKVLFDPVLSVHWRTTEMEPGVVSVGVTDDEVTVAWLNDGQVCRTVWPAEDEPGCEDVVDAVLTGARGHRIVNVDRNGVGFDVGPRLAAFGYEVRWREPGMKFGTSGVQITMTVPVPALRALVAEKGDDVRATSIVGRDMTREEINKMIRALRTARDRAFGKDA